MYHVFVRAFLPAIREATCLILPSQVVGVLEDGKTYATELVQSRKPGEGAVAQWEHELVS